MSMKIGFVLKNIFFLNLIFSLFKYSLNIEEKELKDDDIIKVTTEEEKYISFTISDQIKSELQNSYIHFYTYPQKADEVNGQQIIYSSREENPKLSNAENYSYKFSKNANLILTIPKDNKINLSIKCIKYPCSYDLKVKYEKDYANLNLEEGNNYSNSYSYFIPGNVENKISAMKFKIPSSLNKKYSQGKHLLTISVTNPSDKEAIVLKDNNQSELKVDTYITPMGKIFSIIEEDIPNNSGNNFYYLEIESMEYQFISISIKASSYYDKIETEIIPNESPKYTFVNNTNNFVVKEECFTINEKYINDNLKSENNDLLYASIEYFSLPIKEIVSKSSRYKTSNSSVNFVLKKEDNKYPQFCLKLYNKLENAYMVQVSHVSKEAENVDIYNPISSGFIHMKTLNKNNLALYTYYSDIHFSNRLSFNLRVLKGKPEMYLYTCETYPTCNNDISKLRSDNKNVIKPELKNNQYYYSFNNENKEKDLSPYGPKQKLLYVYCSEESSEELCQFEILIYSNYDEIVLKNNYTNFISYLKNDETDLYKIHIPKGNNKIESVKITLNSNNENVKLESALEDNKTVLLNMKNNNEYEFKPVANFSSLKKDFDVPFNIKANKNISYSFDLSFAVEEPSYETSDGGKTEPEDKPKPIDIKNTTNISLYNVNEIYKIEQIDSMPLLFIFNLSKTKEKFNYTLFRDLLFNFNFNIKNVKNNNKTSVFDKFEIKSNLISSKLNMNEIKNKITEIIYNSEAINGTFDLSTKSVILHFKKKYLIDAWNKTGNKDSESTPSLIFYIDHANTNKTKKIDVKELSYKFFLIYKNSTSNDSIIKQNEYINDRILIGGKDNLNFYRLSTSKTDHNLFVVDFSSNYALSRGIYVTFLDYSTISTIKQDDTIKNSSNIILKKTEERGKIFHFEFELKDKQKDVILCIISKAKKSKKGKPLTNLNYIFKYYTTSDQEKLNNEKSIVFKHKVTQSHINNTTVLSIPNIGKNNTIPKIELFVRKVIKDNRLIREEFDSIGIIDSQYELINGDILFGNDEIKITIPKIDNKEDFYSIFVNIPDLNEKLVYDTINTPEIERQLLVFILILTGIPLLLGLIIAIIIIAYNKTFDKLRDDIMATSFAESGSLGNQKDDEEEELAN